MVCTGAKSKEESRLASRKYARIIQKLNFPVLRKRPTHVNNRIIYELICFLIIAGKIYGIQNSKYSWQL
jgi:TATA-box binding protein (TBP) (component of TFIID and TFIIIB)